jgi:hypothetical protein
MTRSTPQLAVAERRLNQHLEESDAGAGAEGRRGLSFFGPR